MSAPESGDAHKQPSHMEEARPSSEVHTSEEDDNAISWKNWLNLAAFILNISCTWLGSLVGKYRIGEISSKYRTLVNPAGWALIIWWAIFLWEGVFVGLQFLAQFRKSRLVSKISPWWWAVCAFQSAWTPVFTQDLMWPSLLLMFGILGSLLGIAISTDGWQITVKEYFSLRVPFSLHLGWVLCASAVSVNHQADAEKANQQTLLVLAVLSSIIVVMVVIVFSVAVKSPDPWVGFVAAWAFAGICTELANPTKLNDPTRFNPSTWDSQTLHSVQMVALGACLLSAALSALASGLGLRAVAWKSSHVQVKV